MKKTKLMSLLIAGGIGVIILLLWAVDGLQELENKSLDYRMRMRGAMTPPSDIAIVVADEDSIKQLGRWPWQRSLHGKIVEKLTAAGAKAIVFDILFLEPDLDHPGSDEEFGRAASRSGRVVIGSFFQKVTSEGIPAELSLPIEPLLDRRVRTGFVNVYTEVDGINRKIPLVVRHGDGLVPSLALSALSSYLDTSPENILLERRIPLNRYNEMAINYYGGFETFPYYSLYKVLNGEVPGEKLRGKLVLVGGTATALFDFKAVPFSQLFPGVEIHANAISNILQNNYLRPMPSYVALFFIVLFALLSGTVFGSLAPWKGGAATGLVLAGYFYLSYALLKNNFVYMEFVAPAAALSFSYVGVLFYRFMTEEREKRHIKKTFSQYLNPRVMEKVLTDPSYLKLGGQKQELTVLFSDIRGFTTITEALPAEALVSLLNEYLSKMVEVVFRHDGTLDKFIGDAVMAYWGAPVPQSDHAKRAVLCALDMLDELKKLQERWKAEGKSKFDIGIGINTGEMTVGNMGSREKMEYTVIGDNVNLGSRLEGLNKEYGTRIIVSEATYRSVENMVEAAPIGSVKVKGKTKPVGIYTVFCKKGDKPDEELRRKLSEKISGGTENKHDAFDPDRRIDHPGHSQA